ncbi:hypothetical protein OB971_18230 [Bacillus cereus]|nr:hypothetical protein [Bacillus cereus]
MFVIQIHANFLSYYLKQKPTLQQQDRMHSASFVLFAVHVGPFQRLDFLLLESVSATRSNQEAVAQVAQAVMVVVTEVEEVVVQEVVD